MNSSPLDLDVTNKYILRTCVIRAVANMKRLPRLDFDFLKFFKKGGWREGGACPQNPLAARAFGAPNLPRLVLATALVIYYVVL